MLVLTLSRNLMLDSQLVCHHRDEFAICWFGFADVDGITKQMADGIDIAARPLSQVISGQRTVNLRGTVYRNLTL